MESSAVVTPPYVAGPLRLHPFRALMLSPTRVGNPSSARLFSRPYRAVAARLAEWESRGQISRDTEPAVYLHEYTAGGITVRGLVGALDITHRTREAEERAILPHEGIHPVQADELADRMEEMQLNPAPILLVHRSPAAAREILHRRMRERPDHQFTDRGGQRHRIWAIRDPADLEGLDGALAGTRALIADGHHRYAAYLRLQRRHPGPATERGLAMLVDQDDTPLFLGAIHRVLTGVTMSDLRVAAETPGATFTTMSRETALAHLAPACLVVSDGKVWAVIALPPHPGRADVEVLHDDVIPGLPRGPQRVTHHHSVDDALNDLGRHGGTAVLMPAPDVDLVFAIAAHDRLLPEKATSFQPKPSLGVLIRSLHDG